MYEKGLLLQLEAPCETTDESGYCDLSWDEIAHKHVVLDNRKRCDKMLRGKIAYLPHSCEEWVIGGPDEVRALIADLEDMLHKWDKPNNYLIESARIYKKMIDP